MEFLTQNVVLTVLVAARILGLFLTVPLFSMSNVPAMVKAWFVIFLSLIATRFAHAPEGFAIASSFDLAYYILLEALTGVSLGLVFSFAINSLYLAGSVIDMGIGYSMVNVYSPMDEQEIPISTNLFYTVALVVFLITDTHHLMIRSFVESYNYIEIGTVFSKVISIREVLEILVKSYVIGIQMAIPFILVMFVTNMVLGVLSKAMPGLNVFSVGLPLNVLSGLLLLMIVSSFYFNIFENIFVMSIDFMNASFQKLGRLP